MIVAPKNYYKYVPSYEENGNYDKNNQILIQEQTSGIHTSGVIFTKTPDLGAPYFVINFEEGSGTDGITKGSVNNSIKLFRKTPDSLIPKRWKKLISSVREIESVTCFDFLDIEFGITNSNKIIIFQVRPIASLKNNYMKNLDLQIQKLIERNTKKFVEINKKKCKYLREGVNPLKEFIHERSFENHEESPTKAHEMSSGWL